MAATGDGNVCCQMARRTQCPTNRPPWHQRRRVTLSAQKTRYTCSTSAARRSAARDSRIAARQEQEGPQRPRNALHLYVPVDAAPVLLIHMKTHQCPATIGTRPIAQ